MSHTPGPWRYQTEVAVLAGGNVPPVTRYEIYTVSGAYGHPATCERREDARLIAAAPEMLAALEYIVRWEAEGWSPDRARDQAVAAIAKARTGGPL